MQSLLPLAVYCVSLVSLQQLLALAAERPDGNRSDLLDAFIDRTEGKALTHIAVPSSSPIRTPKRLHEFLKHKPASGVAWSNLAWARPAEAVEIERRAPRARRHAHSRGGHQYPHHAQLMRVGCVLGTCQVQNLSHRLYQLIGQSGREDSSPINPRSPHSYG